MSTAAYCLQLYLSMLGSIQDSTEWGGDQLSRECGMETEVIALCGRTGMRKGKKCIKCCLHPARVAPVDTGGEEAKQEGRCADQLRKEWETGSAETAPHWLA